MQNSQQFCSNPLSLNENTTKALNIEVSMLVIQCVSSNLQVNLKK